MRGRLILTDARICYALAAARQLQMTFTRTIAFRLIPTLLTLLTSAALVCAQSADANYPTPVHEKNLTGRIQARDLGDARLTNHYYAFHGAPGDLVITVQSRNLNGDIDVFTAGTLRPLLKLTLYAESTTPVTKGIYLRKTEDLMLRVQARTPNDEEGSYQFFFSGSFRPIEGSDIAEAATPATEAAPSNRSGRRASSVGARIDEPPPPLTEVATIPALPEPTPAPTPVESPSPEVTEKPVEVAPAPARPAPRTARGRRPTTPTTRPTATTSPKPSETPVETAKTEEPAATEPAPKPKPPARSTTRRGSTTTAASRPSEPKAEPKAEPKPEAAEMGPRLIIETNDGTLINQSMSRVKRVTIENGAVVVIGKDGKIDRILLANVVKMSIEPQ